MTLSCPSSRRRLSGRLKKSIEVRTSKEERVEKKPASDRSRSNLEGQGAIGRRRGSAVGLKPGGAEQKVIQ